MKIPAFRLLVLKIIAKLQSLTINHIVMKKLICAIMFLLFSTAASVHAQAFKEMTFFELSAGSGVKHHGITPVDFSFKLHVDLLPFAYIFIAAEDNIALYKNDDAKSYSNGCSMGGGLGFKLLNGVKGKHALDVRVKSLSTLGSPDWKRNTYDASLAWYLKTEKFSPIVEIGYRYLDSRTKGIDNYGNAYLTIGLRY